MRLTNIVWTTAIIAAAIILTAVLSTATLKADGAGGAGQMGLGTEDSTEQGTGALAPVAPRFLSATGLYADVATLKIDARNRLFSPRYPLWSDGAPGYAGAD